jgi:hypothetical protein
MAMPTCTVKLHMVGCRLKECKYVGWKDGEEVWSAAVQK